MSVIINKFEVVTETKPKEGKNMPEEQQAAPEISPQDKLSTAIHNIERMARIRAH